MGKLTNADGTISHEGYWSLDKPYIEEGTVQYSDGTYKGELFGGKRHGHGKY